MKHKNWQPGFKKDSRYHNVLTNLWSKVRPMLRYETTGEPLTGVDIKSSQPFFVATQLIDYFSQESGNQERNMKAAQTHREEEGDQPEVGGGEQRAAHTVHYYSEKNVTATQEVRCEDKVISCLQKDVQRFINLVCNGDIYMTLGELAGYDHLPRDRRKNRVLSMIYDIVRDENSYWQALLKHFPNVARFMREMKAGSDEDSFKRFAQMEQRAESNFVYDHVVKRIFIEEPDTPIWTIHDSILTVPAYQRHVKEVIQQEAGGLFGFVPQLEDVDYDTASTC